MLRKLGTLNIILSASLFVTANRPWSAWFGQGSIKPTFDHRPPTSVPLWHAVHPTSINVRTPFTSAVVSAVLSPFSIHPLDGVTRFAQTPDCCAYIVIGNGESSCRKALANSAGYSVVLLNFSQRPLDSAYRFFCRQDGAFGLGFESAARHPRTVRCVRQRCMPWVSYARLWYLERPSKVSAINAVLIEKVTGVTQDHLRRGARHNTGAV